MTGNTTTVASKEDQRENIVVAAGDVFGKLGYRKATLEQIGMAMGKVKSFVYYYFKSKDELFEAVIDREVSLIRKEFEQILTSPMPASRKLAEYTKKRMLLVFSLANYYELISNGMLTNPGLTEKLRCKYDQKEMDHIKIILEQGIANGEFSLKEVELASITFFMVLKGLEIPLYASAGDAADVNARIDNLLSILFNGILSK